MLKCKVFSAHGRHGVKLGLGVGYETESGFSQSTFGEAKGSFFYAFGLDISGIKQAIGLEFAAQCRRICFIQLFPSSGWLATLQGMRPYVLCFCL